MESTAKLFGTGAVVYGPAFAILFLMPRGKKSED